MVNMPLPHIVPPHSFGELPLDMRRQITGSVSDKSLPTLSIFSITQGSSDSATHAAVHREDLADFPFLTLFCVLNPLTV